MTGPTLADALIKKCTRCGETKPLEFFYRLTAAPDGRRPACKACADAQHAAYRGTRPRKTLEERLSAWILDGTCWRWTRPVNHGGYGSILIEGKMQGVHRAAYTFWIGPIPAGLQIDHVKARGCRFRDCINPDHLEAVTPLVNTRRAAPMACINGHDFTPENTYVWKAGWRRCRACSRENQRRYAARNKVGAL